MAEMAPHVAPIHPDPLSHPLMLADDHIGEDWLRVLGGILGGLDAICNGCRWLRGDPAWAFHGLQILLLPHGAVAVLPFCATEIAELVRAA